MELEARIATADIKRKLNTLSSDLPGHDVAIYEYGAYLAQQLPDHVTPNDFVFAATAALEGFWHSEKGITDRAIIKALVHPQYTGLRTQIPLIANATCPPEFAQKVQTFFDGLTHYQD